MGRVLAIVALVLVVLGGIIFLVLRSDEGSRPGQSQSAPSGGSNPLRDFRIP